MKTVGVSIRVSDMTSMKRFIAATSMLIRSLAGIPELPERVMIALDEVRQAMVELGGDDPGPAPR